LIWAQERRSHKQYMSRMEAIAAVQDASSSHAAPSRKRSSGRVTEAASGIEASMPEQPPLKRRRLSQASVLCMREMFRALIRDGEIGDQERIILQNAAVLLSQVRGETWVHFPDTHGELQPISGTRQQLNTLRSFLGDVAQELQAQEVSMEAEQQETRDLLRLPSVEWSDGITTQELIACCGPVVDLHCPGPRGWVDKVTKALPAQYMVRSRARELLNYYYLRLWEPPSSGTTPAQPSYMQQAEKLLWMGTVIRRMRSLGEMIIVVLNFLGKPCIRTLGVLASSIRLATGHVSSAVVAAVSIAASAVDAGLGALLGSRQPLWPALWFFGAAFFHERVRRLFEFIVLMARLRVMLCLTRWSTTLAVVFYPFIFVAQKFLRWNEQSWLLGCACLDNGHRPSVLSWIPVHAAWGLMWILRLPRRLALPSVLLDVHSDLCDLAEPLLLFLFDFVFSIGIASGLAHLVRLADERAQPRLVLMSMNVAKLLREGPQQKASGMAGATQQQQQLLDASVPDVDSSSAVHTAAAPQDLPSWRADGAWNLFD